MTMSRFSFVVLSVRPFASIGSVCVWYFVWQFGVMAPFAHVFFRIFSSPVAAAFDVRRHLNVITSMFIHNLWSLHSPNPCYHLPTHFRSRSLSALCFCIGFRNCVLGLRLHGLFERGVAARAVQSGQTYENTE